jgi:protoporphyrinogen oxidase
VIGGGQAGLSVSHELLAAGVDHVVLERTTVAQALYFCGVHFLRTRRSSPLFGVGADAAVLARTIVHTQAH